MGSPLTEPRSAGVEAVGAAVGGVEAVEAVAAVAEAEAVVEAVEAAVEVVVVVIAGAAVGVVEAVVGAEEADARAAAAAGAAGAVAEEPFSSTLSWWSRWPSSTAPPRATPLASAIHTPRASGWEDSSSLATRDSSSSAEPGGAAGVGELEDAGEAGSPRAGRRRPRCCCLAEAGVTCPKGTVNWCLAAFASTWASSETRPLAVCWARPARAASCCAASTARSAPRRASMSEWPLAASAGAAMGGEAITRSPAATVAATTCLDAPAAASAATAEDKASETAAIPRAARTRGCAA